MPAASPASILGLPAAALLGVILLAAAWAVLATNRRLKRAGREQAELRALILANEHQLGQARQALEELASTDPLTRAWNRRHFGEMVGGERHRSERYGHPLTLLLLDIDHFKRINDTHGHVQGDQVLLEIANRIRSGIRVSDSLTRWGGETFLILLPNTGLPGGRRLAERIREDIEAHLFERVGRVTASLGLAEYLPPAGLEPWLERADQALCRAKRKGRNRVEYDPQHREKPARTDHVENAFLKLVWSPVYRCGNELIDAQHERLFQLSNDLVEAMLSGQPEDELKLLAANLLSDLAQHFHDEETLLRRLGYHGLREHAELHARLLARGRELRQAFEEGSLALGGLLQFLAQDMVAQHLLKADREFFHLTED